MIIKYLLWDYVFVHLRMIENFFCHIKIEFSSPEMFPTFSEDVACVYDA